MAPTIAFLTPDSQKDELALLIQQHLPVFSRYALVAPEPLSQYLKNITGLPFDAVSAISVGGDLEIAARVVQEQIVAVFSPLDFSQPAAPELDIMALLRVCQIHNVPLATNLATAEAIVDNLAHIRHAHLIFNSIAGQGDSQQELALIRDLLEPHLNLHVLLTTPDISAADLAKEAIAANSDLVIASGGDGTVSAVAGELINTGIPLGIIPRGTANAFCLALGIPSAIAPLRRSCQTLLTGQPRSVDAARCNGLPMILLAGIGYEAETVEKASRELKDRWGPLAYFMAGWQQLSEQQPFDVDLEIDGVDYHFQSAALTVANAAPPTSMLAQGAGSVVFDDGLLDVTVAVAQNSPKSLQQKFQAVSGLMQLMGSALIGSTPDIENLFHFRTPRLKISTTPPQKVVIDGEVVEATSLEIECLPAALTVLVPPTQS
ncbi:MAG: YegS/Rv2252/BmrU family lipid kinase [Leptodesmis sp.]|uniref:YegS/Rv2252/BmrU family lipid kinase n=1 Tax=Leptodesmis sp. TaxID=3100501 RepID=UPI003D12FB08